MSAKGMGAIYTKTSHSSRLRVESFSPDEHNDVMEKLYWPYARALGDVVTVCLDRFSTCLIIDAHSFPSEPLPYEDAHLERPDICIGHDPYHAPCDVLQKLKSISTDRARRVADNSPFAGSYVPLKYYRSEPQVKSLMIEINRGQYMNEADGEKSDRFSEVENVIGTLLEYVAVAL